ncbi:MAG: hypothetical protein QXE23_02345 [Nitrososphaerota archaeon]
MSRDQVDERPCSDRDEMTKYIIGATAVKMVRTGLEVYRDFLMSFSERFMGGHNVPREDKEAVHLEVSWVEELLSRLPQDRELVLENPKATELERLRVGLEVFRTLAEYSKSRLSSVRPGAPLKDLNSALKRVSEELESPRFAVEQRQEA